MSTRSTIQRMTPDGPIGSYHHWDGYPTALGKTLWDAYHQRFQRDLQAMLRLLIDEHPSWSSINGADLSQSPGYGGPDDRPHCFCHGDRSETNGLLPLADAAAVGCEWAYVFYPEQRLLKVVSSYTGDGQKMIGMFGFGDPKAEWRIVAEVQLDGSEPDWNAMESSGGDYDA